MKTVEMPKMGDTMEEGRILRWIKQEGDPVKKGESLAEVETDKVNIEIEAFSSGILRKILVPEGASASIGARIALIGTADEPLPENASGNGKTTTIASSPTPAPQTKSTMHVQEALAGQDRIFISPIARRMAEEHQFDYSLIHGT